MRITPEYAELNRQLHAVGNYGISGHRWAGNARKLCELAQSRDLLDYGCGQGTLARELDFPIRLYDPCIAGLDAEPAPADVVTCTDVLEHIEPECLEDVLDDLRRLTRRLGLFVIATRPAQKVLADGRNAHLIQQPWEWWQARLAARFRICDMRPLQGEFAVVVANLQFSRSATFPSAP